MIVSVLCVDSEFIVSAVAKSSTDDTTVILLWLSIKREHNLRVICVRVTCTILVLDHPHSLVKRLLNQSAFVCPGTMNMT